MSTDPLKNAEKNSAVHAARKLRVGIAGYGVIGQRRRHFIDLHPSLTTVAVCDIKFDKPGIFPDGLAFFKTPEDLLSQNLDILFVCLTNEVAADVTIAGLKKNLHVFCEKPPGRDLDDINRVIQIEKTKPQLKLKYGFNHRYHESVKEALSVIKSNKLGSIINMRGIYGKSKIINFDSDWRTQRARAGGGILLDQGIHMVDLMSLFVGEFSEIKSFVSNSHWHHDVEDNAYALMKTTDGVIAFLHSSATQWRHRFHLEITMAKGSVTLAGILSGSKSYGAETISIVYASEHDGGDPIEHTIRYNNDPSWKEEIADFADCILQDKTVIYGSSSDAFKTMRLVYQIYCADPGWRDQFALTDRILKPAKTGS